MVAQSLRAAALAVPFLLALVPSATATAATTSTGDVDTYNLPVLPSVPSSCDSRDVPRDLDECLPSTITCPAFGHARVVLRLSDPGRMDAVSLTVTPGTGTLVLGSPEDVATSLDPEASVLIRWAGCSARPIAVVTGLAVDGERPYELTVEAASFPDLGSVCVPAC